MTNTNTDPQVVETQVIPQIIRQAQESLRAGTMNPEQFSDLMRQVLLLLLLHHNHNL